VVRTLDDEMSWIVPLSTFKIIGFKFFISVVRRKIYFFVPKSDFLELALSDFGVCNRAAICI
jgi:hypothetical protein